MPNIKTAVSLQEGLFKQAESMARELKLSRSRFFAVALEEFIERHRNRRLLERINAAYEDEPDESERKYLRKMRQRHRKSIEGQW
jgi:metal-responsive CopG/Arc/MetJ family transcriptional regulator